MLIVRDCDETLARGIVDLLDLEYFSCIYVSTVFGAFQNFIAP